MLDPNKNFFIFEMANNHMGDVEHGRRIIRAFAEACAPWRSAFQFGFKLQYRALDTFIHPDFQQRTDLKYIKRFGETRLTPEQFHTLRQEIAAQGFVAVCTPFDEASVDMIDEHRIDVIKIGSCSFPDWPLFERIAKAKQPIIASAAGCPLVDIDNAVSFFDHRRRPLSLLHCVAEYPTPAAHFQLNQIDLFRRRYPHLRIGLSTHERPDETQSIKLAVAKGATVFEKHVGLNTPPHTLNEYSATPEQVRLWLKAAAEAVEMCGQSQGRTEATTLEHATLQSLRRGLYVKHAVAAGERLSQNDLFLAFPAQDGQLNATHATKYGEFVTRKALAAKAPLGQADVQYTDNRERIYEIVKQVRTLLKDAHLTVAGKMDLEISHHYGLTKFDRYGMVMINFVNREYCKKLLLLLPGQEHPEQWHKVKEETFQVLHGSIDLYLNGTMQRCNAGDLVTVDREVRHRFIAPQGAVIEEISSKHVAEDSYYTDAAITQNKNRKTNVTYWSE